MAKSARTATTSDTTPQSSPEPVSALPGAQADPAPAEAQAPVPSTATPPARHYRRIAPGDVSRLAVPYVVVGQTIGEGDADVVVDVAAKDAKKLPGSFLSDTIAGIPSALRRHVEEATYREDETGIVRQVKVADLAEGTVTIETGISPHEWPEA